MAARDKYDALKDFLEARVSGQQTLLAADRIAKHARDMADLARDLWRKSAEQMDAAGLYASEYARLCCADDTEPAWPKGLSASIQAVLEERDWQT